MCIKIHKFIVSFGNKIKEDQNMQWVKLIVIGCAFIFALDLALKKMKSYEYFMCMHCF